MSEPKAIPATYNSFKYRSRTEARWAIFFDQCVEPFEYEKEAYDLEDAGFYMPDFWMPHMNIWIEIKNGNADEIAESKCKALSEKTQQAVLLIDGSPQHHQGLCYCNDLTDSSGGTYGCGWGWQMILVERDPLIGRERLFAVAEMDTSRERQFFDFIWQPLDHLINEKFANDFGLIRSKRDEEFKRRAMTHRFWN